VAWGGVSGSSVLAAPTWCSVRGPARCAGLPGRATGAATARCCRVSADTVPRVRAALAAAVSPRATVLPRWSAAVPVTSVPRGGVGEGPAVAWERQAPAWHGRPDASPRSGMRRRAGVPLLGPPGPSPAEGCRGARRRTTSAATSRDTPRLRRVRKRLPPEGGTPDDVRPRGVADGESDPPPAQCRIWRERPSARAGARPSLSRLADPYACRRWSKPHDLALRLPGSARLQPGMDGLTRRRAAA
jgi:hypothetical protein